MWDFCVHQFQCLSGAATYTGGFIQWVETLGIPRLRLRRYSNDADGDGGPAELRGLALPGFFPLVFREEGKIEKPVTSVYKGRFPIIVEIELKF